MQCLLDPINQRIAHQVETQVHSLQVYFVLIFLAATGHDKVQQELTRLKSEAILCKVEVFNASAQTHCIRKLNGKFVSDSIILHTKFL